MTQKAEEPSPNGSRNGKSSKKKNKPETEEEEYDEEEEDGQDKEKVPKKERSLSLDTGTNLSSDGSGEHVNSPVRNATRCKSDTEVDIIHKMETGRAGDDPFGDDGGRGVSPEEVALLQEQVDQVKKIMEEEVAPKMEERMRLLHELDDRANALSKDSEAFEKTTQKLKNKYYWKSKKCAIITGCVLGTIVLLVVLMVLWSMFGK